MNTSPDHPDFTALALGEHIHGAPAHAVLDALRTSVAARNESEQIQDTAGKLTCALKGEAPLRLDAERRHAILAADPAAVRARFEEEARATTVEEPALFPVRHSRPAWIYSSVAAAALAVASVMVLRFLPGYTAPSHRSVSPVAEQESAPTGRVMVTVPPGSAPGWEKTRVILPAPAIADRDSNLLPPGKGPELPAPAPPDSSLAGERPSSTHDIADPEVPASPPSSKSAPRDPSQRDFATPIVPKKK